MKIHDAVRALMKQGKGILAADESTRTITERFSELGIPSNEDTRRQYRELLLATPGVERYLSGVILFDETIRQALSDGTPFVDFLSARNILVGIKVDEGVVRDPQFEGGEVTKGLEGLRERMREYVSLGAQFTKWRAVHAVAREHSSPAVRENASRMAAYAADALSEGLVPIVEPEVLMQGVHSAEDAERAIQEVLSLTVDALHARDIDLKQVIIKTAMAVSGDMAPERAAPLEVAERTARALVGALPEEIGGVVFLSGGQSPEEATMNLNAIARIEPLPWPITFSFARALQAPALQVWKGDDARRAEAQSVFLERLSLTAAADAAGYSPQQEESSL